jgi:outer membrane protein assembly factor BamB
MRKSTSLSWATSLHRVTFLPQPRLENEISKTGKERWSQPLSWKDLFNVDMVVSDNMIYISAPSGHGNNPTNSVYSFATKDGKQHSNGYDLPASIYAITVLKGTLYVATQDGLYAFDLTSHQQRWHTSLKTETAQQTLVVTRPHIVNGILYTAVVSDNEAGPTVSRLAAFSADNGKQLWQSNLIQGQIFDLTISNGVVYAGSIISNPTAFKGTLGAYDAQSGKQLWSRSTDGGVQWAPSVSNGVVYASAYVGMEQSENVLAVSASDGKSLWQHQVVAGLMTTPYEQSGIVYVGDGFNNGKLYALKAGSGTQVWALNLGGEPQDITVVSN